MTTTILSNLDISLADMQRLVEHEADLLDRQEFEAWVRLFTDDGVYWVPAVPEQANPTEHVSLFYDDKTILETRVQRLGHPKLHAQNPRSRTIRVISNFAVAPHDADLSHACVTSKFIMIEDRPGVERRLFGGRYTHLVRRAGGALLIVQKRVDLTNPDDHFPALTQPF